jgi:pimeloyl-ACP methyl ester carboxylesterase
VLEVHDGGGYRRGVPHVDVNGARLWVEEEGSGTAVLFIHGGLGDLRLWEPQARALSQRFRCIRFDQRLWGRSETPGVEFSLVEDVVGVLDALDVERAALVGLSFGGGVALDVALTHPERVWAVAHVAGGVSGLPVDPYTKEQETAYEAAVDSGLLDTAMEIDFAVWAPLGADDTMRELWRVTPFARGIPEGIVAAARPETHARLAEIAAPTLVILAALDPPEQKDAGRRVARTVPGAQLAEVDSDHYLALRNPQQVTELLLEFLTAAAPEQQDR